MPQIGDIVYQFDENRRRYAPGSNGPPIFREHFRPFRIVGEEKKSWVLCANLALAVADAKNPWPGKVAKNKVLTAEDVDTECWRKDHSIRISDAVRLCRDVGILKQIADLLEYDSSVP